MADAVVDLLVPYWGDPDLLDLTVASVRGQTDPRWRLTVVDDFYPDLTAQQAYADDADDRVRYTRNETNLGVAGNFERCRELASGPLVVFLGCDDLLHPSYVATVLGAADAHPDAGIIQVGVEVIDENGEPAAGLVERVKSALRPRAGGPVELGGERLATSLMRGNWLYWPSLAFRIEPLRRQQFRQDLPTILDLRLVLDMLLSGERLLLVPEVCFSYRRHAASASSTGLVDGARFAEDRRFFAEAAQELGSHGWTRAARSARRRWTSRLHAASMMPGQIRHRAWPEVRDLATHTLSRTGHR